MNHRTALLGLFVSSSLLWAQTPDATALLRQLDARAPRFKEISRQIWENPETGWHTPKSAGLLRDELRQAGFRITENLAGLDSAFVAEWGAGQPVVAILGEYDALPGLSQKDQPTREARVEGAPGHGCGHNLFGTASALAALTVKEHLAAAGLKGTIRFYGTPFEEGGAGKVFLIRAGVFKDVDVALVWHPWDLNAADDNSWLSNVSAKFRFHGKAAHAAGAPDAGRSALDAVELFTHAVNLMREHVPQETRMHYIITRGGAAANIVPDLAELHLIARHPDLTTLKSIWARLTDAARGAALATGTTMEFDYVSAYANILPNPVLRDLIDKNLKLTGGVTYTAEETAFAEKIRASLGLPTLPPLADAGRIQAPRTQLGSASTDVGDVSWTLPTGQLLAATFPPGTPLHSWQSTACAGTEIGRKGMLVAAKTLALTASDLFHQPALATQARQAWKEKLNGRSYESLLPANAKPAVH